MINNLGKILVLLNLAISGLFLAFALGIFTNTIDWGWKEPRKVVDERIPSELDKRMAALDQANREREYAKKRVLQAQRNRLGVEPVWPENKLWYTRRLDSLLSTAPLQDDPFFQNGIPKLVIQNGQPELDKSGRPKTAEPWEFVDPADKTRKVVLQKSLPGYLKEIGDLQQEIINLNQDIKQLIEKQKVITLALGGEVDENLKKKIRPGLYDLLDQESELQKQVKREIETIRPLWVQKLVDAELLLNRRNRLQLRLEELKTELATSTK